ncbi:hypothetical protein [Bacillus sp. DNRA2]|uniref:hypothetical protein n=1 Tax=Bacillus sp. DNRA2 TaxID=2723053 RepID=UPI002006E70F|nr:hypothetical protein [Bacillus sp. DNRA2]
MVNPKSLAIKGGKKLFGKGLNDIGERLTIKLEKPELSNAWAQSGYGENFLHIKKSADVSSPVVNKVVDDVRDVTKDIDKDNIFSNGSFNHVFHGEINKKSKAVGYHHDSMMGGKIVEVTDPPNKYGYIVQ